MAQPLLIPAAPARAAPPRTPRQVSLASRLRRAMGGLRTRRLCADDRLRIEAFDADADTGIVVFGSLNGNFARDRGPEMIGTATAGGTRSCIFVQDPRRSWFQDPGTAARIVDIVTGHWRDRGLTRVMTTGGSMGGYGAIVFARDLGAHAALAFGPQHDISPETMPDDPRWAEARAAIPAFGLGAIDPWIGPHVTYTILHGHKGPDILHWSRFPEGPNIRHFLVEGEGHPIAARLKELGALRPLFEAALAAQDGRVAGLLGEHGGRLRRKGENFTTAPNDWYLHHVAGQAAGLGDPK